jgi:hypothetical protein
MLIRTFLKKRDMAWWVIGKKSYLHFWMLLGTLNPSELVRWITVLKWKGTKLDFGYGSGVDGVFKFIENAEVMAVFFPRFGQSIVIDVRLKEEDPPLVRVVPMARSIADRLRTIKRMRPALPRPRDIVAIPWVGYVGAMDSSGLWKKIIARIEETGFPEALAAADKSFDELVRMERQELAQLIMGEQYDTLWARSTS